MTNHDDTPENRYEEYEALRRHHAREGLPAPAPQTQEERTLDRMYNALTSTPPAAGFAERQAAAASTLLRQDAEQRARRSGNKPWPYWFPWLPIAALATAAVLLLTFGPWNKTTPDTQQSGPLAPDGNSATPGKGAGQPDDAGIYWSEPQYGLALGVRLLANDDRPAGDNAWYPGQLDTIEVFLKNQNRETIQVITAKQSNAYFPPYYPLRPAFEFNGMMLTSALEEPAFPLGENLENVFAINALTEGVVFRAALDSSFLQDSRYQNPKAGYSHLSLCPRFGLAGSGTLSVSYRNTLGAIGTTALWTGDLNVAIPYTVLPFDAMNAQQQLMTLQRLGNTTFERDMLPAVFGGDFLASFPVIGNDSNQEWIVLRNVAFLARWSGSHIALNYHQLLNWAALPEDARDLRSIRLLAWEADQWAEDMQDPRIHWNGIVNGGRRVSVAMNLLVINPTDAAILVPQYQRNTEPGRLATDGMYRFGDMVVNGGTLLNDGNVVELISVPAHHAFLARIDISRSAMTLTADAELSFDNSALYDKLPAEQQVPADKRILLKSNVLKLVLGE